MATINNPRIFLWGALALILYADYDAWVRDYTVPAPAPAARPSSRWSCGRRSRPASRC